MATSKKIRFEVFKRDGFQCAYCGKTPPTVILEVDHIEPKSKGGTDAIENLITSCFDCNRGKGDIPLNVVSPKLAESLEVLREREIQLGEYRKFIKKIERRISKDIEEIAAIYNSHFKKWTLSETFKRVSIKKFLELLPKHEVEDSMEISISRFPDDEDRVIKYFCGICWSKIKEKD